MLLVQVSNIWFGGIKKLWDIWRLGIIQTNLSILSTFPLWFLSPKCFNTSRPKFVNPLAQNLLILLVSNINNGSIWILFEHKKICIKTCIVKNLYEFRQFFLNKFLGPKCLNTSKLYIIVYFSTFN